MKKDKLFFFASYQETRQKNGISPAGYSDPTLVGIPQGDRSNTAAFQAALGAAFCPAAAQPAPPRHLRRFRLPVTARTSIRWPSIFSN